MKTNQTEIRDSKMQAKSILSDLICLASMLMLSLVCSSQAFADGVVLRSDAPGLMRGTVIAANQHVELTESQTVIVLDQSGEVLTLTTSGPYISEVPGSKAASRSAQSGKIGGTRLENREKCYASANKQGGSVTRAMCEKAFPTMAGNLMTLGLFGNGNTVQANDVIALKLNAQFDATVVCRLGANSWLNLGGDTNILNLIEKSPQIAPPPGLASMRAPEQPGSYKITCLAVDATSWRIANRVTELDANTGEDFELIALFATLRGGEAAEETLLLSVE